MHKYFDSTKELLIYFFLLIIVSTGLYSYFESKPLFDSLWWCVVTVTTTGYGDIFPVTWQGRLLAMFLMLTNLLVILPLLISHITTTFMIDKNEFTHHEQEEIKQTLVELKEIVNGLGKNRRN